MPLFGRLSLSRRLPAKTGDVAEADAVATYSRVLPESASGHDAVNGLQSDRVVGAPDCRSESPLTGSPGKTRTKSRTNALRSRQTFPDAIAAVKYGYQTQRDTVRRNHAAWHAEGRPGNVRFWTPDRRSLNGGKQPILQACVLPHDCQPERCSYVCQAFVWQGIRLHA
jgi:hypothetical protein